MSVYYTEEKQCHDNFSLNVHHTVTQKQSFECDVWNINIIKLFLCMTKTKRRNYVLILSYNKSKCHTFLIPSLRVLTLNTSVVK
jgi:protease II